MNASEIAKTEFVNAIGFVPRAELFHFSSPLRHT
jgi:hypothetical protein